MNNSNKSKQRLEALKSLVISSFRDHFGEVVISIDDGYPDDDMRWWINGNGGDDVIAQGKTLEEALDDLIQEQVKAMQAVTITTTKNAQTVKSI